MDEANFWPALEHRVSRELGAIAACRASGLWCDGFVPERREAGRVLGRVWIGSGTGSQEQWSFELLLGELMPGDAGRSDWSKLLPAEDATAWLAVDVARRHLVVAPGEALAAGELDDVGFAQQAVIDQTALEFARTCDRDGVQTVVVMHLNRAFEAELSLPEAAQALGVAAARAGLATDLEDEAFDLLELFGPLLAQQYGAS